MTDQDIRMASATPDVAGVDRTTAPEFMDARYKHEGAAPVGFAQTARGQELRDEYRLAHTQYRASSNKLAPLYDEAKPFVGELPRGKSLTDHAALHAKITKLLEKETLPFDAQNPLRNLRDGIEQHLHVVGSADAVKRKIAAEIPQGHKDFIYAIEREMIEHGGDPIRTLDLAQQRFATAHAAVPKPPGILTKLMGGLGIFRKDAGDVVPPTLSAHGPLDMGKLQVGEAMPVPTPKNGATADKPTGHAHAAREAPRSAKAGPLRRAINRLSVRIEGLGEPAIVPLTAPTQPPAGLVVKPPAPIDFSQPIHVKPAIPPAPRMTATFMPQNMHSEPRYAPLHRWLKDGAPMVAAEEKLVLTPPKGWKPGSDVVNPFANSKLDLQQRRAAVTQAREARLAKQATPIAEVAQKVAHACGSHCDHHAHAHGASTVGHAAEAAKSGRKGWLIAGGAVIAGVAALAIGSHRGQTQREQEPLQR